MQEFLKVNQITISEAMWVLELPGGKHFVKYMIPQPLMLHN